MIIDCQFLNQSPIRGGVTKLALNESSWWKGCLGSTSLPITLGLYLGTVGLSPLHLWAYLLPGSQMLQINPRDHWGAMSQPNV